MKSHKAILIKTIIFGSLSLIVYIILLTAKAYFLKNMYISDILIFLMWAFFVLALYNLLKLIIVKNYKKVFKSFKKAFKYISNLKEKIMPKRKSKRFLRGVRDEKSFIFSDELGKNKKKKHLKWKDLKNNKERIRFIYFNYLIKIIKMGIKIDKSNTPYEIEKKINKLNYNTERLTEIYVKTRYNEKNIEITDDDVYNVNMFVKQAFNK